MTNPVNNEWQISSRIERRKPENAVLRLYLDAHRQSMVQFKRIEREITWMAWVYVVCVAVTVLALALAGLWPI